ncbi:ATP-binding protein [Taklimakanibacter lacteus]|uniref:ATP-binding protein n=1 Tax=Taklimakanibacter lacteus TaxID=2268456 RepID=UPI000E672601
MSAVTETARKVEHSFYWKFNRFLERYLPAGLYQRSLIIVIAPIVLLQCIMVGIILDRHWDNVTKVLARSLSREINLIIELYDKSAKTPDDVGEIEQMANKTLRLNLDIEHNAELPPPVPTPWLSMVDSRLSAYLNNSGKPFWIDSTGKVGYVDIRIEVEKGTVFRILAEDERAFAANTNSLLSWMFMSMLILLSIAIVFMRKQIKPILELAHAARSFGLGRDVSDFNPRGATEVRQAAQAFLNMKERIERHVDQRTAMLAGVSHDLRTILTRFKLELAFLGDNDKVMALKGDVEEMQTMLEAYMNFARGAGGEKAEASDITRMVEGAVKTGAKPNSRVSVDMAPDLVAKVKPNAFRRLIVNLIANAARFGEEIAIRVKAKTNRLVIVIDDNGPGIPANMREDVFRPFFRLDEARNQDETGTGLGLSIARDIARAHGGDITLEESPLGGLRAVVRIPV